MKVTGYKLRESLRKWTLRRDAAIALFEGSLNKFKDESKPTPDEIASRIALAEGSIAHLQLAQAFYNMRVSVTITTGEVPLLAAVKAVGPLTRAEKMWRSAAGIEPSKRSKLFHGLGLTRSKENETALPTITPEECTRAAEKAGRELALLRQAIAAGNLRELDIENLDAALLE